MQTLFISDRMIIEGKIYYAKHKHSHNDITLEDIPYLYIQFIFQVNGKLCKHYTNIEMEEWDEQSTEWLSLKNWDEWYKIFELFQSMGYSFTDECNMRKWISELLEDKKNDIQGMPWRVVESVSY